MPSVPAIHDTPTRVPTGSTVAPATTSPTIWWPGMILAVRRQLAFDDVQIGAAHAARAHTQQHMPGSDARVSHIDYL